MKRTIKRNVLVSLTDRDVRIIQMLASGMSQKQICPELGIGRTRYQQIRWLLFQKLGVNSLAELIVLAIKRKIV